MKQLNYKDLLEVILKSIVKNPDDVKIESSLDQMGVLLQVKVNPDDMKFVIGRKGEMIEGVRRIIRGVGYKEQATVSVKVFDPRDNEKLKSDIKDMEPSAT